MSDIEIKGKLINILDNLIRNGPKCKEGYDIQHLIKRKKRKHIPLD